MWIHTKPQEIATKLPPLHVVVGIMLKFYTYRLNYFLQIIREHEKWNAERKTIVLLGVSDTTEIKFKKEPVELSLRIYILHSLER